MANLTDGDQSFCSASQSGATATAGTATVTATSPLVAGTPSSIAAVSSSTPTSGSGGVWAEFCERHARAASADFARSCVHYITTNLPESARQTVSHRDFMRRFVDCFQEHFGHDFDRRRMQCKVIKTMLCSINIVILREFMEKSSEILAFFFFLRHYGFFSRISKPP